MSQLSVITDGDSPTGRPQYARLHSPTGPSSRATLPFLVLAFAAGVLLGGTWHKRSLPVSPSSKLPSIAADNTAASVLRKPSATDSLPIAWLMSFPNSGTSYTSHLVRKVTGKNTASNYGEESVGAEGTSVGVFGDGPGGGGPFWTDPLKPQYARTASGYLLTKTHCGGRCNQCAIDKYFETQHTFARQCFEGRRVTKDGDGALEETLVSYSKEHVQRAVHLIRDPFDNVVSRFHLTHHHFVKTNQTEQVARYPKSKDGFLAFCRDQGRRFRRQEEQSKFYPDPRRVRDLPCHADLFRYVQWHNLAFATTWDLRVPTLVLHYENYTDAFDRTKARLLDFLEQEEVHAPPAFVTGKTYREYFTAAEIRAASAMFSRLANAQTWEHTQHYFSR